MGTGDGLPSPETAPGATISAALAHHDRDAGGGRIAAQLLIYPASDYDGEWASRTDNGAGYLLTAETIEWFRHQLLPEGSPIDRSDPRVSILGAESHAGLAPAIVATAEFDPLRDEGTAYAEAMMAAGVEVHLRPYAGLIHHFFVLAPLSTAAEAAAHELLGELRSILER